MWGVSTIMLLLQRESKGREFGSSVLNMLTIYLWFAFFAAPDICLQGTLPALESQQSNKCCVKLTKKNLKWITVQLWCLLHFWNRLPFSNPLLCHPKAKPIGTFFHLLSVIISSAEVVLNQQHYNLFLFVCFFGCWIIVSLFVRFLIAGQETLLQKDFSFVIVYYKPVCWMS